MDSSNIIIGVFLSTVFVASALWHIKENAKLERDLPKKMDTQTAQWLVRFAWSRTLQLLAALGACIVMFMNYDKQLVASRGALDSLTEMVEKKDKIEKALAIQQKPAPQVKAAAKTPPVKPNQPPQQMAAVVPAKPATITPVVNPNPPQAVQQAPVNAIVNAPAAVQPPVATPPAVASNPAPVQPPPKIAANPAPPPQQLAVNNANKPEALSAASLSSAASRKQNSANALQPEPTEDNTVEAIDDSAPPSGDANAEPNQSKNETIEALYNPDKDRIDKQSGMNDIKKRYEDIIVIHLFLKKCNQIKPNDFTIISNALSEEIAAMEAPAKLQDDIYMSAQGSYNEIYAKSPCNGKGINNLSSQYRNYIAILAKNYPLQ